MKAKRLPEAVRLSGGLDARTDELRLTLLSRGLQRRTNRQRTATASKTRPECAKQRTAAPHRDGAQATSVSLRGVQLHAVFQAPNVKAKRLPEAVCLSGGLDARTDELRQSLVKRELQ